MKDDGDFSRSEQREAWAAEATEPGSTVEPRLAALLAALTAPPGSERLPGEQQALAAFRAHVETSHRNPCRRPRMLVHTTASKLAAAAMAGGLVLASSAVVASGSLPAGAQLTVRDVFSRVGVDVPGPDEHAGTHPDERRGSGGGTGKGEEVSGLATTTEETGRDKGAQISDLASDGTSRAGESGETSGSSKSSSDTPDSRAPVDPSDAGGAETGAEASSGAGAAAADAVEDVPDEAGAAADDDATDNAPDEVRPTPDLPIPR